MFNTSLARHYHKPCQASHYYGSYIVAVGLMGVEVFNGTCTHHLSTLDSLTLSLVLQSPPPRPPRTYPQTTKGHYSDLAHTLGEERKKATVTATKEQTKSSPTFIDSPVQAEANPYIAEFIRSMSQERMSDDAGASNSQTKTVEKQQPSSYVESPVNPSQEDAEGAAVKRRRVQGSRSVPKSHRRPFRSTHGQPNVEGVRQRMEAVKISPEVRHNPYVEKLARRLQQPFKQEPTHELPSTECKKAPFHNQYVVGFHRSLLNCDPVCQASQQNCHIHER